MFRRGLVVRLVFVGLSFVTLVSGACLSVHRRGDELRFGDPDRDNFCAFATECFGLACPLADSAAWPLSEDVAEEDLPSSPCGLATSPACAAAFALAEQDCAGDEVGRAVWEARRRGFCVRCQRLVRSYLSLRDRCLDAGAPGGAALEQVFVTLGDSVLPTDIAVRSNGAPRQSSQRRRLSELADGLQEKHLGPPAFGRAHLPPLFGGGDITADL